MNIGEFLSAYVACALWASTDDMGEPLDKRFSTDDLSSAFVQTAEEDCRAFVKDNESLLEEAFKTYGYSASSAGHDFWFTRNGHGAGFFDRGLGDTGDRLQKAASSYNNIDVYVGDDDLLYGG